MRCNLRNIGLAALVAGFAALRRTRRLGVTEIPSTIGERPDRFTDRRDSRQDYRSLESWYNKLRYDDKHASRKKLAEDETAIRRNRR